MFENKNLVTPVKGHLGVMEEKNKASELAKKNEIDTLNDQIFLYLKGLSRDKLITVINKYQKLNTVSNTSIDKKSDKEGLISAMINTHIGFKRDNLGSLNRYLKFLKDVDFDREDYEQELDVIDESEVQKLPYQEEIKLINSKINSILNPKFINPQLFASFRAIIEEAGLEYAKSTLLPSSVERTAIVELISRKYSINQQNKTLEQNDSATMVAIPEGSKIPKNFLTLYKEYSDAVNYMISINPDIKFNISS